MIFKSYNVNRGPTDRRGRSCAGPKTMFDIFLKKGWDITCGPAQDRPLRSADLAEK